MIPVSPVSPVFIVTPVSPVTLVTLVTLAPPFVHGYQKSYPRTKGLLVVAPVALAPPPCRLLPLVHG